MPKTKKKFLDKKTATTYNLVGQRTLHPIGEDDPAYTPPTPLTREDLLARQEEQQQYGIFFSDGYDYMKHLREVSHAGGVLEAQYDFRMGQTASDLILETQSVISGASRQSRGGAPSTSKMPYSSTSSMALSAAAMLEAAFNDDTDVDMDPEILEAMKEDFNFEDPSNLLDDNFIVQAKGILDDNDEEYPGLEEDDELAPDYVDPTKSLHKGRMVAAWIDHQTNQINEPNEPNELNESSEPNESNRMSTAAMIKEWVKSRQGEGEGQGGSEGAGWGEGEGEEIEEDKKSRFSNYSMTSSVMRRSNGLRLLDDRFEKMVEQYDDEEIGGLDLDDHEEADGKDSLVLNAIMAETDHSQADFQAMMMAMPEVDPVALKFQYEDDNEEKTMKVVLEEDDDKYDCQSIAGTRTSKAFQPKTLDPPQRPRRIFVDPKTGMPREMPAPRRGRGATDDSGSSGSSSGGSGGSGSDILSLISSLSVARPKNETPEERKLRKQTLKGLRKERRIEKKSCRMAFKEEKVRQEKEVANVQRRLKTISMV